MFGPSCEGQGADVAQSPRGQSPELGGLGPQLFSCGEPELRPQPWWI